MLADLLHQVILSAWNPARLLESLPNDELDDCPWSQSEHLATQALNSVGPGVTAERFLRPDEDIWVEVFCDPRKWTEPPASISWCHTLH